MKKAFFSLALFVSYITHASIGTSMVAAKCIMQSEQDMRPYDAEVEYLETDGNAYIEVGTISAGNGNGTMEIEYWIDTFRAYGNIYGSGGRGSTRICYFFVSSLNWSHIYVGGAVFNAYNFNKTKIWYNHTFTTTPTGTSVKITTNGVQVAYNNFKANPTEGTYKLFNNDQVHPNSSPRRPVPMKSLRIRKFKTTGCYGERDFIPVRIKQTGYMYDLVNGELFGNASDGYFIVGPDVAK